MAIESPRRETKLVIETLKVKILTVVLRETNFEHQNESDQC